MIEYKSLSVSEISKLPELGRANWITSIVISDKIILYREVKRTRSEKKSERTPEYQAFHDKYPKKSGITADKVINLVNELVKSGKYLEMMEGVDRYIKKILVENITMKFVLNPKTFLNEKRWADPFDIMDNRLPVSNKWMIPYFENLDDIQIKRTMEMVKQWETNQGKDITPGVLKNIIDRVLGKNEDS